MLVPKPNHKRRSPQTRTRNNFSEAVRKQIYERDEGTCQQCKYRRGEEVHHVRFKSQGGRGVVTNGVLLCHHCHTICHRTYAMAEFWQKEFISRYGPDYYKDQWDLEL